MGDFHGILPFLRLKSMGLVSLPVLKHDKSLIQVKDEVLTLDAQFFRIRLPARFCEARGE